MNTVANVVDVFKRVRISQDDPTVIDDDSRSRT